MNDIPPAFPIPASYSASTTTTKRNFLRRLVHLLSKGSGTVSNLASKRNCGLYYVDT